MCYHVSYCFLIANLLKTFSFCCVWSCLQIIATISCVDISIILHYKRSYSITAVDLKTPPGAVYAGEAKTGKPGVTLTLSDDDLVEMATGKLDGQKVNIFTLCTLCIAGVSLLPSKVEA